MARKGKDNGYVQPNDSTRNGQGRGLPPMPIFVEGFLNDTDKDWLETHRNTIPECVFALFELVEVGYILSVKFEERSSRFVASLTMREKNHVNSGMCLISRGANPTAALYALYYRHYIKFTEEWRDAGTTATGEFD